MSAMYVFFKVSAVAGLTHCLWQAIVGDIKPEEWERVHHYAMMIYELVMDQTWFSLSVIRRVHPSTWTHILSKLAGNILLPHIKLLCWDVTNLYCLAPLCLLSPSIIDLDINILHPWLPQMGRERHEWQFGCASLLSDVQLMASNIHTIKVSLGGLHAPSSFISLSKFGNLRNLTVTCDNSMTDTDRTCTYGVYHLGSLLHLQQLTLDLDLDSEHSSTAIAPPQLPQPLFPSLRQIALRDRPDTGHAYQMISSVPLEELQVAIHRYEDVGTFRSRCLIWAKIFTRLRVLHLDFDYLALDPPYYSDISSLSYAIEPIYSLHELERVVLKIPLPDITLEDSDLEKMAQAWPMLTSLMLQTHNRPYVRDSPDSCTLTFNGILLLTSCCPHLIALLLPKLYIPAAAAIEVQLEAFTPHGLRYLDVSAAILHDHALCASWLDRCFPDLDSGVSLTKMGPLQYQGPTVMRLEELVASDQWNQVLYELTGRRERRHGQ